MSRKPKTINRARWTARNKGPKVELPPGPDLPIGTEFALDIPMTVRKNEAFKPVIFEEADGSLTPGTILSPKQKQFREFVTLLVRQSKIPRLTFGAWRLDMITYWPRVRHLDQDFPFGDTDASITSVMDALDKGAQLFDDDVRIGPVFADRGFSKDKPGIEVKLRRWK